MKLREVPQAVVRSLRGGGGRMRNQWRRVMQRLYPHGAISEGNTLHLCEDADSAFISMWGAIDRAQKRVWLETYTLEPDSVGLTTLRKLEDAARRGCDVRLIYDSVGSWRVSPAHVRMLEEAGGSAVAFRPMRADWPWRWTWGFLHRNHRKLLLVDEDVAFAGGMNMGGEYAGVAVGGTGYFSDVQVMVEGPAARHLADVFLDSEQEAVRAGGKGEFPVSPLDWYRRWRALMFGTRSEPLSLAALPFAAKVLEEEAAAEEHPRRRRSGSLVQILLSNVLREKRHIQRVLPQVIASAETYCYVTSPYFLPPRRVKNALLDAARRGVDVRIITAGRTDVRLARHAGRYIYDKFLDAGVRIFEVKTSALHAKTVVLDDVYSVVGSFNMDTMSDSRNLEVSLATLDPGFARELKERLGAFQRGSREITLRETRHWPWHIKAMQWTCYQISRLPQARRLEKN